MTFIITGCASERITIQPDIQPAIKPIIQPDPVAQKVTIYSIKQQSGKPLNADTIFQTITESDLIDVFKTSFKEAEAKPGIVKMATPNYKVSIGGSDYYLWINEGKTASMMDLDDTHKLYTISPSATFKLKEILSWSVPVQPVQGIVMDKSIPAQTKSYRVLLITNWNEADRRLTMIEMMEKADRDRQLAWYELDKEAYEKMHIGQLVKIRAANEQLDSYPPIRFSITTQLLEPVITQSIIYSQLIERELINQQLILEPVNQEKEWILDGVTPRTFRAKLENDETTETDAAFQELISIYTYNFAHQLETAIKDFQTQTQLMNLRLPRIYKLNNVMIFYWARSDADEPAKLDPQLNKATELIMAK